VLDVEPVAIPQAQDTVGDPDRLAVGMDVQ
jgi:hypothetical protein